MVAPAVIAAGKKAAPVAKAAARKAAENPDAMLLVGLIGLVVVGTMMKRAVSLPGELFGDAKDRLGDAWDRFREFGEVDIPNLTSDLLLWPSEATNDAIAAARGQSRSVVTGFLNVDFDADDPGPEYYAKVHYDASGVAIAVPVLVDRTAKGIGRTIRGMVGDWSLPGF